MQLDGRRVRDAGGGPWIRSLIYAALGRAPEREPITTELENRENTVDLKVRVPRSRLTDTPPGEPGPGR